MPMLDEQRERARAMVRRPGGDLSARAATCLSVVLGALEDAERLAAEMHVTMRRMADERDAARAELEAARAVVEHVREARGVCLWRSKMGDDATACGRCDDCTAGRLIVDYDAAKAGKAVE